MQNKPTTRRQFIADALKLAGATAITGMLPDSIARAQAIPAATVTGTIQDVKHVVILMQENRSFDHYLGIAPPDFAHPSASSRSRRASATHAVAPSRSF